MTVVTGDRLYFRRYEILRALLHRYALGYQLVGVVMLVILPVRAEFGLLSATERLILCGSTGMLLIAVAMVLIFTLERLLGRNGTVRIHASPIIAVGVLAAVVAGNMILHSYIGTRTTIAQTLVLWAFFQVYVEALMLLIMYLSMPKIVRDLRKTDAPAEPATGPGVSIGGQMFAVASLQRIEAEGNYLRVTTRTGRHLVPGPFGKATEPLPPQLGLRIGRSDWVAAAAVVGLRTDERDLLVVLECGATVRVSQARRKAVEAWAKGLPQLAGQGGSGQVDVDPDGAVVRGDGQKGGDRIVSPRPENAGTGHGQIGRGQQIGQP